LVKQPAERNRHFAESQKQERQHVALPPEQDPRRIEELARQQRVQEEMLLREVDDAVRQDSLVTFMRKYGKPVGAAVVLFLAVLGGWLWWDARQESAMERESEALISAIDQWDSGNLDEADNRLTDLAENGGPGAKAAAQMLRAGIAAQRGCDQEAINGFEAVAADTSLPENYRNLATIRSVALQYDSMAPAQVIERLKPLAVPGNPWFGSAAEMVAMAHLEQGKTELAGSLFTQLAADEKAPQSLRSRARQMAGLLGYDAVVDVDATLAEMQQETGAPMPEAAQ